MFKIRPYRALVVLALIVPIGGSAQVRLWAQGKDVGEGAQQFVQYCAGCHGADGRGGDKAPSLVSASGQATHSDAELVRIIHGARWVGCLPLPRSEMQTLRRWFNFCVRSRASPGPRVQKAQLQGMQMPAGRYSSGRRNVQRAT